MFLPIIFINIIVWSSLFICINFRHRNNLCVSKEQKIDIKLRFSLFYPWLTSNRQDTERNKTDDFFLCHLLTINAKCFTWTCLDSHTRIPCAARTHSTAPKLTRRKKPNGKKHFFSSLQSFWASWLTHWAKAHFANEFVHKLASTKYCINEFYHLIVLPRTVRESTQKYIPINYSTYKCIKSRKIVDRICRLVWISFVIFFQLITSIQPSLILYSTNRVLFFLNSFNFVFARMEFRL